MTPSRPRVLAVSSGGGHWVQLLRLRPAFAEAEVIFATVRPGYASEVSGHPFHVIPDANRSHPFKLIWLALAMLVLLLRLRPDVIISTGAAPGYFALRLGKLVRARTIWIDSIANAEVLSLSGQKVGRYADLWLTQWPHLAKDQGPIFKGNVL